MCHTTKDNIVKTLRELMKERPLRKIKVQDVMMATGMTRQSFYYHFQDIYQVVEWEVERKLLSKLTYDPNIDVFQWYRLCISEMDKDADFYRRVVKNIAPESIRRLLFPLISPYISQFLFGDAEISNNALDNTESFSRSVLCEVMFNALILHTERRSPLSPEEVADRMKAMDMILTGTKKELMEHRKS